MNYTTTIYGGWTIRRAGALWKATRLAAGIEINLKAKSRLTLHKRIDEWVLPFNATDYTIIGLRLRQLHRVLGATHHCMTADSVPTDLWDRTVADARFLLDLTRYYACTEPLPLADPVIEAARTGRAVVS